MSATSRPHQAVPGWQASLASAIRQYVAESPLNRLRDSGVPVRERLLRLLLRLADRYGEKTPDATVIELRITQQELADMVGASRVMVANVLGQLQAEGVVQRSDGRYQLRRQSCMLKHFS